MSVNGVSFTTNAVVNELINLESVRGRIKYCYRVFEFCYWNKIYVVMAKTINCPTSLHKKDDCDICLFLAQLFSALLCLDVWYSSRACIFNYLWPYTASHCFDSSGRQ